MKHKKTLIISLSLIFSANAFANITDTSNSEHHPIKSEYYPLEEYNQFIGNPLFDKIISDSYVQIKRYDTNTYQIKLDKELAKDLAEYFKEKNIQNVPDYLKDKSIQDAYDNINNNIVNNDRHIEIEANNKNFKNKIIDYFTSLPIKKGDKNLSLNRDELIDIMKGNERIIISATEKPGIDLEEINSQGDLYTYIDNIATKNSSLFILDENIDKKINRVEKSLEQEDYLIKNSIQDHKQRTREDIEEHQEKITLNTNKIEQNKKDIIINISDTAKNKIDIQETNKYIEDNKNKIIINSDAIEKNERKIIINTSDIEKNKIDIQETNKNIEDNKNNIIINSDTIEENKNSIINNTSIIDDIKENTINNININGVKLPLKNHLSHLYNEQSIGRSQFNTLKENFEHFKSDTQNRFYKVEKRANQGIASVAAMSNLPFTDTATFSTAIGIGNYRNATALAWGMQYRINENIKVRASTAWNDSNNFVSAGGVGISW